MIRVADLFIYGPPTGPTVSARRPSAANGLNVCIASSVNEPKGRPDAGAVDQGLQAGQLD
jgi:hypothetical protein